MRGVLETDINSIIVTAGGLNNRMLDFSLEFLDPYSRLLSEVAPAKKDVGCR